MPSPAAFRGDVAGNVGGKTSVPSLRDSIVSHCYPGLPSGATICRSSGAGLGVSPPFGETKSRSCAVEQGPKCVRENLCRPSRTRSIFPLTPGTYVPGYPMPPLRGWNLLALFHRLGQNLVLTHTLRPMSFVGISGTLRLATLAQGRLKN